MRAVSNARESNRRLNLRVRCEYLFASVNFESCPIFVRTTACAVRAGGAIAKSTGAANVFSCRCLVYLAAE
ncbi:conserved hypothetical protein [Paraburkholderia caribensis]|nr:conserved hypothetical protein [Paraburkholderia caribensis]